MGLTSALGSALSGLRVTQSQVELISQNIANADSVGYTRRKLNVVQQLTGASTTGVRSQGIQRQLDTLVQKQLRLETAGAAFTDVRAGYAQQIDQLYGTPGQAGSLDSLVNNFTSALQALTANPSDFSARSQVLSHAQGLASQLNGLTGDIQRLRANAEAEIGSGVQQINTLLSNIAAIDKKLFSNGVANANSPALLDERDTAINALSQLVDLSVVPQANGRLNIFTSGGLQLYGAQPVVLSFDARPAIGANSLFTSNSIDRGVGSIRVGSPGGPGVDIIASRLFGSGSIAAQVEARDKTLVEAQNQLDELAAGLAAALGDRNPAIPVTTGLNAGFDVELNDPGAPGNLALKAGNTLTFEVKTPTGPRRIQLIGTDGAAPNPLPIDYTEGGATIIRYDRSGGIAGVQGAVAAALGAGFTVSLTGTTLRVVDAGGGNGVINARASFSTTDTFGQGAELPLFSDGATGTIITGTLDTPNPQKRGLAGRLSVNPAVLADASKLVNFGGPVTPTPQGDSTRPRLLLDRLTNSQRGFAIGAGIGEPGIGFRSTVVEFARRVVEDQGAKASNALNVDQGQKLVLRSVEARFSETSGVSIDQELSDLVEVQNAYAANARVVSAVKDLLDTLLRIGA